MFAICLKTLKRIKKLKNFGHLQEKNGERSSEIGFFQASCKYSFMSVGIGQVSCHPETQAMKK